MREIIITAIVGIALIVGQVVAQQIQPDQAGIILMIAVLGHALNIKLTITKPTS